MRKIVSLLLLVLISSIFVGCGGTDDSTQDKVSGVSLNNFDNNVSPGNDFYTYVNGSWIKRTKIPADKSSYSSFSEVAEKTEKNLQNIIRNIGEKTVKQRDADEQKIWNLYSSYMDTKTIENLGLTPLQATIDTIVAIQNYDDLTEVMSDLSIKQTTLPLFPYVAPDAKDSKKNIVYMYQDGLGLPDRDYYIKTTTHFTDIQAKYKKYISAILTLSNYAGDTDAVAKDIYTLESKIAKIQWTNEENRDAIKTYNKMSVNDFNTSMGDFNLKLFLEKIDLGSINDIVVVEPSYFHDFGALFKQVPLQTWKAYLLFHFISDKASLLDAKFATLHFGFYSTTLNGIVAQKTREKQAIHCVNEVLGQLFGKLYVENYFPEEAKREMKTLVQNILTTYDTSINELTWMSDTTKQAARTKLHKITAKIGYPDKWQDYSSLEIKENTLVANILRYSEYNHKQAIAELTQPVDRTKWYMNPQTVNAYYDPSTNEVVFPAAILQPPFFNMDADMAINYGGIGSVIGHEISHAFDDYGSKYDGDGNLHNWWTAEDAKKFKALGDKLVVQYDKYEPLAGHHINGRLTLGENMADLNGVSISYKAYQLSIKGKSQKVLDGFSGNQRFFIGWSQVWRTKMREEALLKRIITDPHSPAKFRVIGVLSNITPFYKAFNVQEGDAMYKPENQRIKIW